MEMQSARDLWRECRGSNMSKLIPFISKNTRLKLGAVVLNNVTGAIYLEDIVQMGTLM